MVRKNHAIWLLCIFLSITILLHTYLMNVKVYISHFIYQWYLLISFTFILVALNYFIFLKGWGEGIIPLICERRSWFGKSSYTLQGDSAYSAHMSCCMHPNSAQSHEIKCNKRARPMCAKIVIAIQTLCHALSDRYLLVDHSKPTQICAMSPWQFIGSTCI